MSSLPISPPMTLGNANSPRQLSAHLEKGADGVQPNPPNLSC